MPGPVSRTVMRCEPARTPSAQTASLSIAQKRRRRDEANRLWYTLVKSGQLESLSLRVRNGDAPAIQRLLSAQNMSLTLAERLGMERLGTYHQKTILIDYDDTREGARPKGYVMGLNSVTDYWDTLRPWLHLATLTTDCKVFQDQSVVDIIETVLGEYPFAADKRLIERYPQRDYTVQYNESDYEFLSSLMQEWGINHHFEHSAGVHRLIWSDHNGAFQAVQPELQAGESAYHRIPYHPQGHKTERESIHGWSVEQRLTSGRYASRDLDYTRPGALLEVQAEGARAGGHANQEVYLWRGDKAAAHGQGAVAGSDHSQPNAGAQQAANQTQAQGEHLARLRMQALRQGGHRARGVGHLRGIVPGCSFHLTEHPQASANTEYLTLQAHLLIENVGEESQRSASAPAVQAGSRMRW